MDDQLNPDELNGAQFDAEAAQAAERVINDGNPEYTQHHPDAVTDKAKAEEMAYASKNYEEGVVEHANKAVKYSQYIDPESKTDEQFDEVLKARQKNWEEDSRSKGINTAVYTQGRPTKESVATDLRDTAIKTAKYARERADDTSDLAAKTYDSMTNEHKEIVSIANDLKSGKQIEQEQPDESQQPDAEQPPQQAA